MAQFFNLSKREAAAPQLNTPSAPAINWQTLPGQTDADKAQHLRGEFADLLDSSPNPIYDAYGAIQDKPKVPKDGTVTSPDHMLPAHTRFQQIKTYVSSLDATEAAKVLAAFDGNVQTVVQQALALFGNRFVPEIAALFTERSSKGKVENVLNLGPEYDAEKSSLVRAARQNHVQRLQISMTKASLRWNQDYGLTLQQCSWMLNHSRSADLTTLPDYDGTATRLGNGDAAKGHKVLSQLLAEAEKEGSTKVYNQQADDMVANLWSDDGDWTPEFRQLVKDPQMLAFAEDTRKRIDKYEVTKLIGLSPLNFPQKPSDMFDVPEVPYSSADKKDLTPEQLAERDKVKVYTRKNPFNLQLLADLMEKAGYTYNGNGMPDFFQERFTKQALDPLNPEEWQKVQQALIDGTPLEELDIQSNEWIDHALFYISHTLCEKNPKLWNEMMVDAGIGTAEEVAANSKKRTYPDPMFEQFLLNFRSKDERACVNKLRNTFGLQAVPYPMGIPIIDGCNVNDAGFQIDFMIPSDILATWVADRDGTMHPVIEQRHVLVGEYFGFDHTRLIQVNAKKGEGFYDIDGSIAKVKGPDGKEVEARNGTLITAGAKYDIRTRWKKMTESFFAESTGNAAIHIDKDLRDGPIMAELDRNHMIYQTSVCAPNNPGCSIAMHQLQIHMKTCNKPDCDARKYLHLDPVTQEHSYVAKQYTAAEAFVKCAIQDLQLQKGMMPTVVEQQQQNGFGREKVFAYYEERQRARVKMAELWHSYTEISQKEGQDSPEAKRLYQVYVVVMQSAMHAKSSHLAQVTKSYNERIKNDPQYLQGLQKLQAILDQLEAAKTDPSKAIPDRQVRDAVVAIIRPYVPFADARPVAQKAAAAHNSLWYRQGLNSS